MPALLTPLFGRSVRAAPDQQSGLATPAAWLMELLTGGTEANAGVVVNENTALMSTAVFSCIRVLSETVASLPLPVYRRAQSGGKERAEDHPLYTILHDQPNPEMTSFEWREVETSHLALWGNAFSEIERDGAGRPVALWPLRPDRMMVERVNGRLVYWYTLPSGEQVPMPPWAVHHVRGLSPDGRVGYSPIRLAREAIGLALATEGFGARFFKNDARPGVVLVHPGRLGQKGQDNLRDSWDKEFAGLKNKHRTAVLEEGVRIEQVGIPPEDAQFLETRKFQLNEIARFWRIPPHMVGDLDRSTNNNIEHQSIEFVVHTIRPYLVRWEQAIRRDLILPSERRAIFAEFLVDGLLRGDIQSRYSAYAVGRQNGWLSANDIRALENMNPIPSGNTYLVPLNMVPAGGEGKPVSAQPGGNEKKSLDAMEPVLTDAMGRICRRAEADVMREARNRAKRDSSSGFLPWLEGFYTDHLAFAERNLKPIFEVLGDPEKAREVAKRHVERSKETLKRVLFDALESQNDPLAALQTAFDDLEAQKEEVWR